MAPASASDTSTEPGAGMEGGSNLKSSEAVPQTRREVKMIDG